MPQYLAKIWVWIDADNEEMAKIEAQLRGKIAFGDSFENVEIFGDENLDKAFGA